IATHVVRLLDEFREESRKVSPTFQVWNNYLSRVSTPLKLLLASTRSPSWTVYQHAKLQLMPLLFASNHTIYATFMSIQILTMNRLPTEVEEGFLACLFTKTVTRKYRGDCSSCRIVDVRGELKVSKDWKMFLSNGQNKERLIQFYSGYMAEHACTKLKPQEVLLINGGKSTPCVIVTTNGCCNQPILDTNQEEADTVMILHAKYEADRGSTCIAIHSPDTDALVLLLHHYRYIGAAHLCMSTGRVTLHTDGRRFIPVHQLINKLTKDQLNILLSVYCITGCDTTSGFFGKGKRRNNCFPTFKEQHALGLLSVCTGETTCKLFIHQLRCIKAKSSVHPRNIPPTADSLNLHLQRCVIQLWIWRHATTAQHDLPPFTYFGYEIDGDGLTPKMMSQPAAAPELLNDLVCECEICSETCVCFANRQPCTVACSCTRNTNTDEMMCT
ncbi:hypothetical protein MAR_003320, partial [Mya arenaria]